MNRRQTLFMLAGVATISVTRTAAAQTVAGDSQPAGPFDIVAEFPDPGPSGVAVTPDGRIFVGFPRHAGDHDRSTLAELKNGVLVPFPDAVTNARSGPPDRRLISVHGMTIDSRGRLWVIDDGKVARQPIQPGAAKIVGFDLAANTHIATIVLKPPVLLPDSHMNDLRVDPTHGARGMAYVADSSFGVTPALVVVDLATGRQRRVLGSHPSTQAEPGFVAVLEGRPLRYDPEHPTFPVGGIDGITLSADNRRLYYCPLTSRRLYSIATDLIADFETGEDALAHGVVDEGEKAMCDGLATDPQGRIYITAGEHDAIFRRNIDGSMEVIARDPRIIWPDGICATQTHVYCILGQWNRLPAFNGGANLRRPPYLLVRIPTGAQPAAQFQGIMQ